MNVNNAERLIEARRIQRKFEAVTQQVRKLDDTSHDWEPKKDSVLLEDAPEPWSPSNVKKKILDPFSPARATLSGGAEFGEQVTEMDIKRNGGDHGFDLETFKVEPHPGGLGRSLLTYSEGGGFPIVDVHRLSVDTEGNIHSLTSYDLMGGKVMRQEHTDFLTDQVSVPRQT